jgi:hypothetical protein
MKRVVSLVLAILMLVTVTAVPVSAAEKGTSLSLSVVPVTIENKSMTEVTDEGHEYTADSYFLVKVNLKNGATEQYIQGVQLSVNYDPDAVVPYRFNSSSGRVGYGIAPAGFAGNVESAITSEGTVQIGLMTSGWIYVDANETANIASFLFQVKSTAETSSYGFAINTEAETIIEALVDPDGTETAYIDCDYSEAKYDLAIKGAVPTLASVAVDKDEVGYASGDVITLSAKSASGNDITGLVRFSIKDYTGTGLEITGNQLTVSDENPANVGTYTVVATPDGTNCTLAEGASAPEATFTITSKKVTDPKVEITDFVKGKTYFDMHVNTTTPGLTVGCIAYEGEGIDQNNQLKGGDVFKADTTYTIVITLTANANYVIDTTQKLTYTINGGEEQEAKIEKGPEFNGVSEYQAVVTATTADKDEPTLDLKDLSATYGDKLLNLKLDSCSASFNGQPVEGTFAWADEYNAETPVGDAGEQTFDVVFTPTDKEVYATVTGTVTVTVAQKEIEFKTSDYEWKSINPDDTYTVDSYGRMCFQYDGNEHGIEPNCKNDDIRDLVEFEYVAQFTTNKSTNVIGSTVKAQVLLKNNNYKFDKTSTVIKDGDWKVVPIVIDYAGEYTHSVDVCYTTSSVDIPLSAFGLPDEVLNDTNNKYLMRNEAVVVDEGDVISGTPTAFDDTTLTLTLNLKSSLTKDDAGKTASVTLGLKVNNYETTNPGVEEIAGGEDKLFILKLNVKIIEKENAGLTITGIPESLVYGESAEWSYNVTKPGENGNISGSVTPAGILNNDPYKLTAIGVGEATVTITYSSDTTYAQEKFTITVTPKPLTAAVSHDPITYGDPTPTEGYTVTFNGLLTGDVLADTDYTVGTEYKQGDPVGKYAFTCVLNSETVKNYKLDTVNGELVVNKKELTDGDVTVTVLGETPVYDGSEKKPAVEVKYGETTLAAADYTVSYSNNVNAGVNTASVTVTSNDNSSYKFTATKNFTIAQAPISGAMIANIPSVTYNTRAHTPEVTVRFNGSKLTDADYTVSYSEDCINAGTVTVTVTGKGNFTGTASKTFTINKAGLTLNPCTISELCTETDLKTRTLPSDFFLAGETETGFSIKLTAVEGGDDIFAVAPAVVEGENKITFRLKNEVGAATFTVTVTPVSGNYNGGSYALTISTHDRTDVSGSIEFKDGSAVYTGTGIKYENATISGYSGTLRYGYTPNASTGASLDASGLPLTVGTYTVAVTFNSDASFGYKTATFTITKATPTGTPGYTKLESSGKTLADAKLTVGTIRPAGTIAWDLPLTTVLEDGKAYAWTFTPNDTHNYTILTGTLVPYVDDGMDYIPGVIGGNTGSFNFHDVSRLDYFYDAVKWAAENGIASGTGRYTFSPNAVCTRAQTVTFLWRAAGSPLPRYRVCPFTDVQPSDYYYNAVLWAVEQGITTGLNATTFGPDVTVTRGQVATFLYRAASAAKPSTFNPFTDVKTTAYNYDAILWAYDNRITTGTSDTTFSPDAYCTRAQIVTFLYRYYQGR